MSAFSGEYPGIVDPAGTAIHSIKDARLLLGLRAFLFFSLAHSVGNLWILRLVGLVGLILLSDLVNCRLLRVSSRHWAVFASTIAFTSILFKFFTHWASAFRFLWVAVLSLTGLSFWIKNHGFRK